ncbi:MAG: polyphosphate kinase [Acidimicrobiales bacterium]|nr:MAG: polyphosphate kinase [Acidimicrobiales bacterium]
MSGSSAPNRVGGWDVNDTTLLNRELSWLAFNARVLALAGDPDTPLLEQVAFLAIYASNLDEFFQVRVAGLDDQVAGGITTPGPDGRTPREQVAAIRDVVTDLGTQHEEVIVKQVMPALHDAGIELVDEADLTDGERTELAERFRQRIFPILTPLAVDPGHPFPYISDLSLNLAVVVRDRVDGRSRFARVKVPSTIDRWQKIGEGRYVALETVIQAHLDQLFEGMEIVESHVFRVTRNADLTLEDAEADDLLAAVEMELRRRRFGRAVRLEVAATISDAVLDLLIRELDLEPHEIYPTAAPLDATSLFEIAGLDRPELTWPDWQGVVEPALVGEDGPAEFFAAMRRGDVFLHHPYSSFGSSVVEFIRQASRDPQVLAIKLTLYRTSGDSTIIDALIRASEAGKQIAVLVELKARFDEAANIGWARRLEQAGVHVAYGIVGLKIHSKICMVVRQEADGIRRYCHVGTGNYNHHTARVYEDFGVLTADAEVGDDLADLFNGLTGYSHAQQFARLLVAPHHLRSELYRLLDREIASGRGRVVMKMNSLVDADMIAKLYEASQAGVDIDLIVRGICCLRPGVPGLSDRIRVRSVVGRYLEHSRIYQFGNGNGPGDPLTYIGSADLMTRNLDRRIEVLLEVRDEATLARLQESIDVNLTDDRLAWTLDGSGVWTRRRGTVGIDAHERFQQLARARSAAHA